jgi:hypothetical protein
MGNEVVETQAVALDDPKVSMSEFIAARQKGNTETITVEKEPEVSGSQEEAGSVTDAEQPQSKEGKSQAEEEPWTPAMQAALDKRIKRELAKIRKESESAKPAETATEEPARPAPQVNTDDPEPQLSEHPTAAEIRAHTAWGIRQAERNLNIREFEKARLAKYPDWKETVETTTATVRPLAQKTILTLRPEVNQAVLHYLATEADLDEFNGLSETEQADEIIRLSASLLPSGSAAKPALNAKPESRAPAPIRPVGGASTKSSVALDEMPISDYMKARRAGRER